MNTIHLISQSAFFKGIAPENRRALAAVCHAVELKKHDGLFREGESGTSFYLLVQGRIQLHKTAPDGREVVIKIIKPGEVFAEVVLFEEPRYPVTATALTACLLLRILRRDLHQLLREEAFRNDFIALLMRKQRYLAGRIHQLTTLSVEERLLAFLREQYGHGPAITVTIAKKQIAAAIGTAPETLSRAIRRLAKQRVLTWRGKKLVLHRA